MLLSAPECQHEFEARGPTLHEPGPSLEFYTRELEPVDDDLTIKIDSLFNDGPDDEPEMIWLSLKGGLFYNVNAHRCNIVAIFTPSKMTIFR